jgi:NADH-quinone oxidoreductase subunit A
VAVQEYLGILVAFVLAGAFAAANIVLATRLGPRRPSAVKAEPFECGQAPIALSAGRLSVKFYLTAILFIVFDVELVFLYPWAVVYRTLAGSGLVEMVIFLGVLMVGFFYAWDNGALEWH